MSWTEPYALFALIFPAGIAAWLVVRATRTPVAWWPKISRVSLVGRNVQPIEVTRNRRPWLLLLALTLTIVALAGPRWGDPHKFAVEESREVMIALDLSRSMMVEDVGSTRLDRARSLMTGLLDHLHGERVGLIVFAGSSFVQVPLSSDYAIIKEFLPLLEPSYMPQGGSDYTGMLKSALEGFSAEKETDRYLIVLSDGESTTEGWREPALEMARRDIRVIALAIGSEQGGLVPINENEGENPTAVISKLQPATLHALAATTGGVYELTSEKTDLTSVLSDTVEQGRKGKFERQLNQARPERYQWFLFPAAILGLWGLYRELGVRPRLRKIHRLIDVAGIQTGAVPASIWALAALAGITAWTDARAHNDRGDDGISFKASVESTAANRLLGVIEHLSRNGYDAADILTFAEETLNYGIEAQTNQLPLQAGAIQDAIDATREAEKLNPKETDWNYLRARLQKLLEPPTDADNKPRKPKEDKKGFDEEDRQVEAAGDANQQQTSADGGTGGPVKSDAAMGELRNSMARTGKKSELPPVKIRALSENQATAGAGPEENAIRKLTIRNWHDVVKQDSPGAVHHALQGKTETKAEGGLDY